MPIRPENKHRYPQDWKTRSRFVRFYRAKNRCEWCGAENYQPHPITGSKVVLTVAHVFDDRPEASGLLNLAALCQKCHNGHDAKARRQGIKERLHKKSGQMGLKIIA
jgi:5-methylcytosine-specific restriction endonuclease McrA